MIKYKRFFFTSLYLFYGFISAAIASSSSSTDIPLEAPSGFIPLAIEIIGKGVYCISGEAVDDTGPTTTAWVALVDADKHQVVWKTSIPFEQPFVGNSAIRCVSSGAAYYVLTQQRTHSEESLNQTKVVVHELSTTGKLVRAAPVEAGFDEWSYLLEAKSNVISVAGGLSDTLNRGGKFSTFFAQFDPDLTRIKLTKIPNGSFWSDTNAHIEGSRLRVAGRFLPDRGNSSSGTEAFAISSIDLVKSKYIWSNYVSPASEPAEKSLLALDGASYYVAVTSGGLAITALDSAGRKTSAFKVSKLICDIHALTIDGHALSVIGSTCNQNPMGALVVIDLVSKNVKTTRLIGRNISSAEFDGNSWVGVLDSPVDGAVFTRKVR